MNTIEAERYGLPQPTKPVCRKVLLEGEIVSGDFAAFRSMLETNEPYVDEIALLSPGGDVAESLKIEHLIRERMLRTHSPIRGRDFNVLVGPDKPLCKGDQCYCASSCFFIWAAGIERSGTAIIVHRPRDASGNFGRKQAAVASSESNALLSTISDYLLQMEVPTAIIWYTNSISSHYSSYLHKEQVKEYVEGYPPSTHAFSVEDL